MFVFQANILPLLQFQHERGPFFDLVGYLLGGFFNGRSRNIGRAAGISPHVKRRHVRVAGIHEDVCQRHAQHFGGHLRQHRVGPRAQIGRANQHVKRAVVVHFDGRAAHVQAGNGRAVHAHRRAQAAPQMGLAGHFVPAGLELALPVDGLHALLKTFIQAARFNDGHVDDRFLFAFAQQRGDGHGVAGLHPVFAAELDGIHAQLVGDLVHVAFQREERLRARRSRDTRRARADWCRRRCSQIRGWGSCSCSGRAGR